VVDRTAKRAPIKDMRRLAIAGVLSLLMMIGVGTIASMAPPRAHVYLLRGLMNIFSLGMDTLAEKIQRRGIHATVHNHAEWQTLADNAAAAYHAGKEGPIIIVGHSLGADAVMQMSAYLGRKGVPVALAVPFDARGSYATSSVCRESISGPAFSSRKSSDTQSDWPKPFAKPSTYSENRDAASPDFGKAISLLPLLKSQVCQILDSSSARAATF
jgi:hypothetical protein